MDSKRKSLQSARASNRGSKLLQPEPRRPSMVTAVPGSHRHSLVEEAKKPETNSRRASVKSVGIIKPESAMDVDDDKDFPDQADCGEVYDSMEVEEPVVVMDYFEQLETALMRTKAELHMKMSELPPVISKEKLFTLGLPHVYDTDMFNRSPSNRIATNYSPAADRFVEMKPEVRVVHHEESSIYLDYLATPLETKKEWVIPDLMKPEVANEKLHATALARLHRDRRVKAGLKRSLSPDSDKSSWVYPENERYFRGGSPKMTKVVPTKETLVSLRASWKKIKCTDDPEPSSTESCASTWDESGSESGSEFCLKCGIHHVNMGTLEFNRARKISAYGGKIGKRISIVDRKYFPAPPIVESPRSRIKARSKPTPCSAQNIYSAAENIIKYEYYLDEGVEEKYITPLREKWLTSAAHRIGNRWQLRLPSETYHDVMVHVALQIKYYYLYSMRKAITDYVLKDESERKRLGLVNLDQALQALSTGFIGKPTTVQILSQHWRNAVLEAHDSLALKMFRLNPLALEVMALWEKNFSNSLFLEVMSANFTAGLPYELAAFETEQKDLASKRRVLIIREWLPLVCDKLKYAIPKPTMEMIGFYQAMAVLMSRQIRQLVEDSIVSYTKFFAQYKEGSSYEWEGSQEDTAKVPALPVEGSGDVKADTTDGIFAMEPPTEEKLRQFFGKQRLASDKTSSENWSPPFYISLKNDHGVYSCEPTFEELAESLLRVVDWSVYESSGFMRVDSDHIDPSMRTMPHMVLEDELVQVAKNYLRQIVFANSKGPQQIMRSFEKFKDLASLNAYAFAKDFGLMEKPLEEYKDTLAKYNERTVQAQEASANEIDCGLVRVRCEAFKQTLIDKAQLVNTLLKQQVLAQMTAGHQEVIDRHEHISNTVGKDPTNAEEATSLRKYFFAAANEMAVLERMLEENKRREFFLEEAMFGLPEDDFQKMMVAREWPKRIRVILSVHQRRIQEEYDHYEAGLKKRRVEFAKKLEIYGEEIKKFETYGDIEKSPVIGKLAMDLSKGLEEALDIAELINTEEGYFGMPPSRFPQIQTLTTALEPYLKLWGIAHSFKTNEEEWMIAWLNTLDTEKIEGEVMTWWRTVFKLVKQFTDVLPEPAKVAVALKALLDRFKESLPLLKCLCNPGLRARHFIQISEVVGFEVHNDDGTNFRQLLRLQIDEHIVKLEEISEYASKEFALERSLDTMESDWKPLKFEYSLYKNTGANILKGGPIEEAQLMLDEHVVKTQNMLASAFAAPFQERLQIWLGKVTLLQQILVEWLKMQASWMYLEPIFGSEDILEQMPKEGGLFHQNDKVWRRIMAAAEKCDIMLDACAIENLLQDLKKSNVDLDVVQKGLNYYLETKRLAFPRFFFLSNDELLEILSETKDPLRVQPFLKKCFEGINTLVFEANLDIISMVSVEKEKIDFTRITNPKFAKGNVERWLIEVEKMMRETLLVVAQKAAADYAVTARTQWILKWPGMIVLCASQIHWTREVAEAIQAGGEAGLNQYEEKCSLQLQDLVKLVRGELTTLERFTIGALCVVDVHARDVVTLLKTSGVTKDTDFEWLCQLRYSLIDGAVIVMMVNATRKYGYEYLGNSARLVITPLTDRCYRTLMGALHLNLGGAPEGPAGTGKTETTKDLAKALAMQCVVFNCSDGLDYLAMGKFFKGLAASGAWACFDEFNRIDLEVLSVIAQQILTIQRAIMAGVTRFNFEGTDLPLISTCTTFITMNPGYAGRSELPDNLKALFRPVAMMVPNYAMIGEITLYSYGYLNARDMARKLVATYRLCSEQLSSQDHYDYGMRAVIAVLRAAGNLKRRYREDDEAVLMLRAIRDVNLPKFLSHDIPLFEGIMSDLFPGVILPEPDYVNILNCIKDNCKKTNLQPTEVFCKKILELYEMIIVRHGLMLVGYSFGAKTSAYKILAASLSDLCVAGLNNENISKYKVLNPKSITMGQLYGQFDPVSHEWTDGVLATTFRQMSIDLSPDRNWLIFDGPVDAIWIENMNTVLDDNKKLCLMSGEIIQMTASMNLIFEVQDLAAASPATVSRCGMIYVEPSTLGWRPLLKSWLIALPEPMQERYREQIAKLCEWLLPPCLRCVQKNCKLGMPMQEQNMVQSMLRILTCLSQPELTDKIMSEKMDGNLRATWVDCITLFALVWSVGACMDTDQRTKFDFLLKKLLANQPPEEYKPHILTPARKVAINFPDGKSVYDCVFRKDKGKWGLWLDFVDDQGPAVDADFVKIIVSTADTAKYTFMFQTIIDKNMPLLLAGPTGTGKSVYVKQYMMKLDPAKWQSMFFNFSAQTSANQTQDIIDGKLIKRRPGVFGPQKGKQCVIFVDDLSMPALEKYGAQPPVELLRQWMDHHGWYDRNDLTFRNIEDVQFVSAMGPPGGGKNPVTNRYLRHFNVVVVTAFSDPTMQRIFSTLVDFWMKRARYSAAILKLRGPLVNATIEIYQVVQKELLPTPEKSHYTYNLRDLGKVFLGLQFAPIEIGDDTYKIVRLWAHECLRVFYDRLINDKDRLWFCELLAEQLEKHFRERFGKVYGTFSHSEVKKGDISPAILQYVMAGDFMIPGADPMLYDEITDEEQLLRIMLSYLEDYNDLTSTPMNLVLFQFAIQHIARICRVIKQPGGNVLMVGVGGSGRQSLARLAAFIEGFDVYQVELSKNFGMPEWRESIGIMLRKAGELDKKVMFLFPDTQIKMEGFVEDINSLLNTGEVPNLYDAGDLGAICEGIRPRAKRAKRDGSRLELLSFFVDECNRNMRIALAFSPIGDTFRERLRKFPSLVNCCTIDWFSAWPTEALRSVAVRFLATLNAERKVIREIVDITVYFHTSVQEMAVDYFTQLRRYCYVTPTSFLELINLYKTLLEQKQNEVKGFKHRYEMGLLKLEKSAEDVNVMGRELELLQPKLDASTQEVMDLLRVIDRETVEANKVRTVVLAEEAAANIKADEAKAIKEDTEAELQIVMPILEEALRALDTLTKNDISELKGMKSPPLPVRIVMEAVCIMKNIKPTRMKDPSGSGKMIDDYWESSKKMLADADFLKSLKEYDKDNIPPAVIVKVRPYIENPDMDPTKIQAVSKAAYGLCCWIGAMEKYDKAAKIVAPKQAALKVAEGEYKEVMSKLKEKQDALKVVEARLAELDATLLEAREKKKAVQDEADTCAMKISRANQLMTGLGGEKTRWTASAEAFGQTYIKLTGDILLASGMISYLGVFTPAFRDIAIKNWWQMCKDRRVPCSDSFSLSSILADPVQVRAWNIAGLPKDSSSVDNGAIVSNCRRWPLMIDPQGQANKWVKNMEGEKLVICKLADTDFLRKLENAIQFGKSVLLENIGTELDAVLEPVLLRSTFKHSGSICIKLGDNILEYHNKFRLYITTKLRNPHYSPEISAKVTLLNFMITTEGLIDQLLGIAVAKERPELEEQKNQLIIQGAKNKQQLKEIEDKTLEVLSQEGNILEDETGIQVLNSSKILSEDITEKQRVAETTEAVIDETRMSYIPVAKLASILFFCVSDMANIEPMYQYSLPWFVELFVSSILNSTKDPDLNIRLENLNIHFKYSIYCNVSRSLFEKDKILFVLLMSIKIIGGEGHMDPEELRFFMTGGVALEKEPDKPEGPDALWINDKIWGELYRLSKLENFTDLYLNIGNEIKHWRRIFDSTKPQEEPLPSPWAEDLHTFQKLLILRAIRPDKVVLGVTNYVEEVLGKKFIEPLPLNLEACYMDASSTTPLVFVLSPGSDPMSSLLKLSSDKGAKLQTVSLGQGQGPVATAIMQEAAKDGSWVALQNCHLAVSWMPTFEKYWETELTSKEKVHEKFRLWLTSYPSEHFPVAVLQNAVKMTNEPPSGLKANMTGSYLMYPISDPEFFGHCSKEKEWRRMLYGLCFFHAYVQERRKFGPLGWNIPYEFNESDLRISVRQLKMFIEEYPEEIPYKALNYLTGECNYGGRVTDDHDRRTLLTILSDFYCEKIHQDDYPFSESGIYKAPPYGEYQSYIDFIKELPSQPTPEIYGFHDNADITKDMTSTERLLTSLLLAAPSTQAATKSGDKKGPSPDEQLLNIVVDIQGKIPANFDIEQAQIKFPVTYLESMNTVLCQELERYNKLITIIRISLDQIQKAVKGLIVMSSDLELLGRNLVDGKIPVMWAAKSYPSRKPLANYVADLLNRVAFFQDWVSNGSPMIFWISGFFFTQSFLTGAKQNFARAKHFPIDMIDFEFQVIEDPATITTKPEVGVYVKGLFLEGARYDYKTHALGESQQKVLYTPAPIIWMIPNEVIKFKSFPHYMCPMYKTSDRRGILSTTGHSTNFVMEVLLPSLHPQSHWIKRGVALLTQLDE
ncbi:dynein axonemal heavy chain [Marchantia polymorpha subsp. ruderalis]